MFNSKIFNKYFPILTNITSFNEEEKKTLQKWIRDFEEDVKLREMELKRYPPILTPTYNTYNLDRFNQEKMLEMLEKNEFDDYGAVFLNYIIYRHKYNHLLAWYIFPILTPRKVEKYFNQSKQERKGGSHG